MMESDSARDSPAMLHHSGSLLRVPSALSEQRESPMRQELSGCASPASEACTDTEKDTPERLLASEIPLRLTPRQHSLALKVIQAWTQCLRQRASKDEYRRILVRTIVLLWRSRVAKRNWTMMRSPVHQRSRRSFQCQSVHAAKFYTPHKLDIIKKLGEGSFAEVFLSRVKTTHEQLVVKVFKTEISDMNPQAQATFLQEMDFQQALFHPNVLEFKGVFWHRGRLNLVSEYVSGGTLLDLLTSEAPLPWPARARMAEDIAAGMAYLHGQSLIHRDLKSANCLLRADQTVVIIDFGLSRRLQSERATQQQQHVAHRYSCIKEQLSLLAQPPSPVPSPGSTHRRESVARRRLRRQPSEIDSDAVRALLTAASHSVPQGYSTKIGTAYYMAPELYLGQNYNEAIDVFSYGIVVAELVARVFADPDLMPRTILWENGNMAFGLDEKAFRAQYGAECPPELMHVIVSCCSVSPAARPRFEHIRDCLHFFNSGLSEVDEGDAPDTKPASRGSLELIERIAALGSAGAGAGAAAAGP